VAEARLAPSARAVRLALVARAAQWRLMARAAWRRPLAVTPALWDARLAVVLGSG